MEIQDVELFLSYKHNPETQNLDNTTIDLLNNLFSSDKKKKKPVKKNNILKNYKIQNKKDNISNKVILILNKLSESNINNLVMEFIDNINQVDQENFVEIQKTFYVKIINEINFVKIYLQFLKIIGCLYNKVQNYNLSFFYSIVETKFKLDYENITLSEQYIFLSEHDGEIKRLNNLELIKNMVENNFFSQVLLDNCDKIIITQNIYLTDIYYWFNSKTRKLTEEESNKINLFLKKDGISQRETVLLENMKTKPKSNNEKYYLEYENIIEEYLLMKNIDDLKFYIDTKCTDANEKNKLCEVLLFIYFNKDNEIANDIIDLSKILIKKQILFKSNLSRGLLLIKEKNLIKSTDKIKNVLIILKNMGITKGLEKMMDTHKVCYNT
jgi:hypothetical protein